jgi:tetratricopeptide (TPR) repeat protein
VADIERRLDDRFRLLTRGARTAHPRQQTLQALIDWSYDLLDVPEQTVLCRLSVFAGGWTLEAAEAVCSRTELGARVLVDVLGSLVDKSLVQTVATPDGLRYRLLETVREYSAEKLSGRGEAEGGSARRAHADFFLDLAEVAASHLRGAEQGPWLDRLELEHDNLRIAIAYFTSHQVTTEASVRMGVALREFWVRRGYLGEGIEVLDGVLEQPEKGSPPGIRAAVLIAAGRLRSELGKDATGRDMLTKALEMARGLGDAALTADALLCLSFFPLDCGDYSAALELSDEAVALAVGAHEPSLLADAYMIRGIALQVSDPAAACRDYAEALSRHRAAEDCYGTGAVLGVLAMLELADGRLDEARSHLNQALTCLKETKDYRELVYKLNNLGLVNLLEGDQPGAREAFLDALVLARRMAIPIPMGFAILGLAACASAIGRNSRAATLYGGAATLLDEFKLSFTPDLQRFVEGWRDRLRQTMGAADFAAAYQSGRSMSTAEAVDLALRPPDTSPGESAARNALHGTDARF